MSGKHAPHETDAATVSLGTIVIDAPPDKVTAFRLLLPAFALDLMGMQQLKTTV